MRLFVSGAVFGLLVGMLVMPRSSSAQQQSPNDRFLTILTDPKANEALARSGGLNVVFWHGKDGKVISLGQPRWIVPGIVKPVIYGDATRAEYYFFDQQTGDKEGPFKPEAE